MVAGSKVAKAKGKTVAVRKTVTQPKEAEQVISVLACPFRNLMKYRQSDACKKAMHAHAYIRIYLYICGCVYAHMEELQLLYPYTLGGAAAAAPE